MAALILRLRVDLLLAPLRGQRQRTARFITSFLLLVIATVAAALAVRALAATTATVAETVVVLVGAAIVVGACAAPVVAGATDPLDPRNFIGLPIEPRWLPLTLLGAAFISVPTIALMIVLGIVAGVTIDHGAPPAVAIASAICALFTCIIGARLALVITARILPERRSRELTALFALAVIVVAIPTALLLVSSTWGDGGVPTQLQTATAIAANTPFGAAFAWPFAAASGNSSQALLSGFIAVGTVFVFAALWQWRVMRVFSAGQTRQRSQEWGGLGWFSLLPANAFGAVAARSLTYWLRDRRYIANVVIIPVAAVIAIVPLLVAGVPMVHAAALPVLILALFLGWLPHNDTAYDSTALWTHVSAGVRGTADRWGRLVPIILISVPLIAIALAGTLAVIGRWSLLPTLIGATFALFFSGLGLSSIASAVYPYAVTHPGDSPFKQPQRSSLSHGGWGQAGTLLGALVLASPTLWLAWQALIDPTRSVTTALVTGVITGVVVVALGTVIGGVLFERRGTRLMEFIDSF
ncbi:hypothetical protein [Microbacterium sp. YY-01]|uniref:hypothetical protein n=1 Tax=Microbacterium sp. YY-01 TaxID=3421634 RepID=UPI003D173F8F